MSQTPADKELLDFIAQLDNEFGKKSKKDKDTAQSRNTAWHSANPKLGSSMGKSPERLNPEDSKQWRPVAKITHVVRQGCKCCNAHVDFIGGEFIKFVSVMPFGGEILRRAENCVDMFLYHSIAEPLEDIIEWHSQDVFRCAGCIAVEQQAVEIWEAALEQERQAYKQNVLDITEPFRVTEKGKVVKEITIEIEGEVK